MHTCQRNLWAAIHTLFNNLQAAIHTLFNNTIEAGSEVFNLLKEEKETNEKLNQEIQCLISENNSIKFENLTLKAKVNELRNTIDAYSDQIDNEFERPKKNLSPQKLGFGERIIFKINTALCSVHLLKLSQMTSPLTLPETDIT